MILKCSEQGKGLRGHIYISYHYQYEFLPKNILRIKVLSKHVEPNIKRINLFNMIMINAFFLKIVSECV